MSIFLRGACALLAGAALGVPALAQQGEAKLAAFTDGAEASVVEQVSCNACGPVCDLGCDPCGPCGGGMPVGQVFVGAEWLNVRANFSEATAYREFDVINDQEIFHQFDMNYGSSYRVYAGYRLCECGGEVRFTYTNIDTDGGFASGPNPNLTTDGRTFFGPYEVALGDDDELVGNASVNIDNYDLGFSKTIPLGCPLQCGPSCGDCGDCASCCDPCGCGPVCPAWDITWSGAVRFANVNSALAYQTIRDPANTTPNRSALSTVDFDGVGLRFGLGGRRYFGRRGMLSAYVKGDISLLLGEVEHTVTGTALTGPTITTTQVVPVTEIEAGLTAQLTSNLNFTAGYLLAAWHDLGHRTEYDYTVTGTQIQSMDDANMMTIDGFFLRAEAAF